MHAAMVIAELLRPNLKEGAKVPYSSFMLQHPEDRKQKGAMDFLMQLDARARRDKRKKS